MEDLISIIIPCYNAGKTISHTLNSVREQNYKNLEIIIVNDGSIDNSLEIISNYKTLDKRIVVYSQKNAGVSVARNNGLKLAKGEYIVFLDADDNYTSPFSLSKMVDLLKEHDADMCICGFFHPCYEKYITEGVYDLTNKKQFMDFYQDFFAFGMPWNKVAKRSCYTEPFIEGITFTEDEIFNLYNLHNIKQVVVTNENLHNYYCAPLHSNTVSAVNSLRYTNFTLWQAGMKTQNYRLTAIQKYFPDKIADMQYVRCFDFFFWDFLINAKNKLSSNKIFKICKINMHQKLFKQALEDKQRHGLKLKNYTDQDIKLFVNLAHFAFNDIKTYNKQLSIYKVLLALFGYFYYKIDKQVETLDILVKTYIDLLQNATAESNYVNNLLEMKKFKLLK